MPEPPTAAEIRALRESHGLTIRAFAPLVPVHWVTLARWETGRQHPTGLYADRLRQMIADQGRVSRPKKGGKDDNE